MKRSVLTHSGRVPATVSWAKFLTFSLTTWMPRSSEALSSSTLCLYSSGLQERQWRMAGFTQNGNPWTENRWLSKLKQGYDGTFWKCIKLKFLPLTNNTFINSLTHKVLWQLLRWWRSFLFQEGHRRASWEAAIKSQNLVRLHPPGFVGQHNEHYLVGVCLYTFLCCFVNTDFISFIY